MTIHGILPINKPRGKTSFQIVATIRRLFQEKTVGHAGTLDPFATGVLIIMIGRKFTRLSDQFLGQDKEYRAKLLLGSATDTYDLEGMTIATSFYIPSLQEIESALQQFQGTVLQIPPMFSAKKVEGKKLYELARQGKTIERKPCPVHLKTELLSYHYPYIDLKIQCSKGTYIRSIAHDLGNQLTSHAHLVELERTRSGNFHLNSCFNFEELLSMNIQEDIFSLTDEGIINAHFQRTCRT